MGTINNLAESVGDTQIAVATTHIQRALSALRRYLADAGKNDEAKTDHLQEMDRFTFDEVMLAARLIATVERVHNTDYLSAFIEPLVSEGKSVSWTHYDDAHIRLLAKGPLVERVMAIKARSSRSKTARAA
jgi:hypothetical protein